MSTPTPTTIPPRTRPPAVAGTFYPRDPEQLRALVDGLLAAAPAVPASDPPPKAMVVPHAGFVYSGPIAATAYTRLRPLADRVRRVVLLGPAHRAYVEGLALPDAEALATPLGSIPVDAEAVRALERFPFVTRSAHAHALEHSLEVQLPFLQRALSDFALVPLVVGDAAPGDVAAVIDALWGGDETVVLISSDLSHYHPYLEARAIDAATAAGIVALSDQPVDPRRACGAYPLNGMILAARARGLRPALLDLRNSGDTAGPRDQVVGYGAFAFYA